MSDEQYIEQLKAEGKLSAGTFYYYSHLWKQCIPIIGPATYRWCVVNGFDILGSYAE